MMHRKLIKEPLTVCLNNYLNGQMSGKFRIELYRLKNLEKERHAACYIRASSRL